MNVVDLRSDTVTKPTPAMWEAMAHAEPTIVAGLSWLAHKGQLAYELGSGGMLDLRLGDGVARPGLDEVQGQLVAALEETAAYRAYYRRAEARYVIR